jgi:hypothetical protein
MLVALCATNITEESSRSHRILKDEGLVPQATHSSPRSSSAYIIRSVVMLSRFPGPTKASKLDLLEPEGPSLDTSQTSASASLGSPIRLAAPAMDSRISIEKYLSAPLSHDAASAPAMSLAICDQHSYDWYESPATLYQSRATSVDLQSHHRPTISTTGTIPKTVDMSGAISSMSQIRPPVESDGTIGFSEPRKVTVSAGSLSPKRPATSGTIGPIEMTREWVETVEKTLPNSPSSGITKHSVKAKEEIDKIQRKAKELELMMQQFEDDRRIRHRDPSKVVDGAAEARLAANPTLAWTPDSGHMSTTHVAGPGTILDTTTGVLDSPSSAEWVRDTSRSITPRTSKSSGTSNVAARTRDRSVSLKSPNIGERHPAKKPCFYCTFCHKRFHGRIEWLRHERTVHVPEQTWVCCPRTGAFPLRCPFCEKVRPSPAHLADHNYLSCQKNPVSERTFARKDHFLQHIARIHKISPEQKPACLTELENAWRHPLPIQIGHQALHCGFCGATFATYEERTSHVDRHFTEGADMMSWWKDRISHEMEIAADITSYQQ